MQQKCVSCLADAERLSMAKYSNVTENMLHHNQYKGNVMCYEMIYQLHDV